MTVPRFEFWVGLIGVGGLVAGGILTVMLHLDTQRQTSIEKVGGQVEKLSERVEARFDKVDASVVQIRDRVMQGDVAIPQARVLDASQNLNAQGELIASRVEKLTDKVEVLTEVAAANNGAVKFLVQQQVDGRTFTRELSQARYRMLMTEDGVSATLSPATKQLTYQGTVYNCAETALTAIVAMSDSKLLSCAKN